MLWRHSLFNIPSSNDLKLVRVVVREWGGKLEFPPPPDSISCHFVSSWSFDLKIEYDRAERHTLEALFSDSDLGLTGPPPAELLGPWSKSFGTSAQNAIGTVRDETQARTRTRCGMLLQCPNALLCHIRRIC